MEDNTVIDNVDTKTEDKVEEVTNVAETKVKRKRGRKPKIKVVEDQFLKVEDGRYVCAMCSASKPLTEYEDKPNGKGKFVTCNSCRLYSLKYKNSLRPKITCPCGYVSSLSRYNTHVTTRDHFISLAMKELHWTSDNPIDNFLREKGHKPLMLSGRLSTMHLTEKSNEQTDVEPKDITTTTNN